MAVFFGAAIALAKLRIESILERGIMSFLSKKTQKVLLERSIFDFLCDLWFMPRIGLYLKAIFRPFIIAIPPEEAAHVFEELPESSQRIFLQKGIVNLLPPKLKTAVLPKALRTMEIDVQDDKLESSEERNTIELHHHAKENSVAVSYDPDRIRETEIVSSKDKNSMISTDDEYRKSIRPHFVEKQEEEKKNAVSLSGDSNEASNPQSQSEEERSIVTTSKSVRIPRKKSGEFKIPKKLERVFAFDPLDGKGYRTEVISSNKLPVMKKHVSAPIQVQKWDKLELFLKIRSEKARLAKDAPPRGAAPLKGPLAMIENFKKIVHLKKAGFLSHIDEKKLLKIFALSSLTLLVQFTISKKTRTWLFNTFHILMYVVGILLSSSTFGLYLLKLKKRRQQQRLEESEEHRISH
eukprot:CAMPEP_0176419906 /NCGR_PEP_ID=MMETSP0127-20121128/8312_1 /TAXON_ID=938130 /ORGANISM="Platyophrya macrostoma, Strain WH" /LENGTH=407 /DNA_ID=CAMNT_0017800445 /DNA_START=171 /DNA_END=1394 /DNA_ORIENTATION=+